MSKYEVGVRIELINGVYYVYHNGRCRAVTKTKAEADKKRIALLAN